ncbi:hypothetical protein CDAR_200281 [Caerostris darwini]|uniref:RNase H type-1 domain-containing protein n=1 Tax=Caerostris darwini TaxID=1538125 RepID=A0AAV4RPL5_9ARAC|nr:hypothetical protein CDAR_200281 [Caerostris darwini]
MSIFFFIEKLKIYPSHIGLCGNEIADLLEMEGTSNLPTSNDSLTFSGICSKIRTSNQQLWKIPLSLPWYNMQAPGGDLIIKADRVIQITNSRLCKWTYEVPFF